MISTSDFNMSPEDFGKCMIDVKDSMKGLMRGIHRMLTVQGNCEDPQSKECMNNVLKIVDAFAGLADYIAGALGYCTQDASFRLPATCTQVSVELFHSISAVSRAAMQMSHACKLSDVEQAYLVHG